MANKKISQLTPVTIIPSTSTTVLQDGAGGNKQAPITGQSVQTNHTPVNYSSAGTQITQHITGIDNALGSLGGNTVNFNAYNSAVQSIPANGTFVVVQFNQAPLNTGGSFNTTTYRDQPNVPGVYLYMIQPAMQPQTLATSFVVWALYKNGVLVYETEPVTFTVSATIAIPPVIVPVQMNGATDYVDVRVQVSGPGAAAQNTISNQTVCYFSGALLDQKGSSVTPATVLRTINFSKNGSDVDGDGTLDFPLASAVAATNLALTLSPTIANPMYISGDPGTYSETGLKIYPNINWIGNDVILSNDVDLTYDSSWEGKSISTAAFTMDGINIPLTTGINLFTTGFTTIGGLITFKNLETNTPFLISNDHVAHGIQLAVDNALIGAGVVGSIIIESVNTTSKNGSSFGDGSTVNFSSNTKSASFYQTGGSRADDWYLTSGTAGKDVTFENYSSKLPSNIISDTTLGGNVSISTDATTQQNYSTYNGVTAPSIFNTFLRGTNEAQPLTDAATVTWINDFGVNAVLAIGGNRTLANMTGNNFVDGQIYRLQVYQTAPGSYTLAYGNMYIFASGTPVLNPVSLSSTIFTFQYSSFIDKLICIDISYDQQNWRTFTGANNTVGTLQGIVGNPTGGASIAPIPGTNNVLIVWQNFSTALFALAVTLDGNGNVTNCPAAATTITTTTLNTAETPQICVMPDGLNAIISYGALRSAVYCQNLISVGIAGIVLTVGTETQVRASEAITAVFNGTVCALTNSNFSLVFRTTTANILYAYQMSLSGGVITIGTNPLTIETGNAAGGATRQATRTSTTVRLFYGSKVTATTDFMYTAVLTFNGINNLPTIGALYRFTSNTLSIAARNCRVDNLPGSATKFVITAAAAGGTLYCQVIDDASGVLSGAGAVYSSTTINNPGVAFTATFLPDANTMFLYFGNSQAANSGLVILNISPAYAITVQNIWYSLGVAATSSFSPDFTAVPIGNNAKVGFLIFGSINTGNLLTTVSVRS